MNSDLTEKLWWHLTWLCVFLFCAACLLSGCANPHKHITYSSGITTVDLSGRGFSELEIAELVEELAQLWEISDLGKATAVRASLYGMPVKAYFPQEGYFQCSHVIGEGTGFCVGSSAPDRNLAIFATASPGEHLGCGSLPHELMHTLLYRLKGDVDGKHTKFPVVWGRGGFLDIILLRFGCRMDPGSLTEWK
jgi:hypothetical protein